ncbi:MAG: thioredoxin family protein [Fibrobacter sp.]|nr:thioredoxin family protein [Fibrobacter sp.]
MLSFVCNTQAEEFNMNGMQPPKIWMEYSAGSLSESSHVIVDVTIPDNWHVNANEVTDEFLKPSSVDIKAKGIEFGAPVWPAYIKEYNEALDLEIFVFKGEFQIRIPVKSVAKDYDSLTTKAVFHYQACDNSICLAPAEVSVGIEEGAGLRAKSRSESLGSTVNNGAGKDAELKKKDGEVSESVAGASSTEGVAVTLSLLFFAFLGGIILNLMPCVLPVLSLKLFSLIKQAGESRARLLALGLSTTAGILVSFWILATIISVIKAGGGAAGWGMQFQSAGFIAFMVVILAAFAMSFFGVFEVWLPGSATTRMDEAGRKAGLGGAFFTGALLVLLSTPCSAPLLGTAMGFAFTATTPVLFLFFTAAGVGLAAPYLLVSAFPAILNILPKPGAWMVTLQKVMGVLLLATVAWLLWVVNEQAGTTGVLLFAAVAAIAIACSFAIGKIAPPGAAFAREIGAFAVSAVVLAALWFALLGPKYEAVVTERFEARASEQMLEGGWYRYSEKLVADFAKSGRTVFIDVTADWCLTCKANEAAVLSGSEFLRKMDSAGVARVKADWTRETPEVNALLKSLGKSGVPAYAIYPHGDAGKQFVLPELLTTDAILEKLP